MYKRKIVGIMRYILKIVKDYDYDLPAPKGKSYPILLTQAPDSEYIGFESFKSTIKEVYQQIVDKFLPKIKTLLKENEFFNFWLGDTLTGNEIIFFISYSGEVYIQAEDIEPVSSVFQVYMEENHPEVLEKIKKEWMKKMFENEKRKKQQESKKKKQNIQPIDERSLWPTWKVTYRAESGNIYTENVRATDEMHAYDVAKDYFWDIADAGDDKLVDILKIERVNKSNSGSIYD